MRLQIALDCTKTSAALKILKEVRRYVDIAEVGTGLMLSEGVRAVRDIKKKYPDLTVLSDMKIMDGGGELASIAFEAGADIVTVLGVAADATIEEAVKAAKKHGRKILVDLIAADNVAGRAKEVDALGADYVCVHTSYDLRNARAAPLEDLRKIIKILKNAKAAISGGIRMDTLGEILSIGPEIIITGGAIMKAEDPETAARRFREAIRTRSGA
jgi:3-hexulose-6-phosphate synthase